MSYLILSNGDVFEGRQSGYPATAVGELVFTTGRNGYLETLTDPSYAGQVVIQTFPMIGNYGLIPEDFEGRPALRGYSVRELCAQPENFRCRGPLGEYLMDMHIPCLTGLDTRHLTRILREYGTMNAMICEHMPQDLSILKTYRVSGEVLRCSCREPEVSEPEHVLHTVVLMDYGAKKNIVRELLSRSCRVICMPATASAQDVLSLHPDGIMLSHGPGDPAENEYQIQQIRKMLGQVPVFGICLGHQLTALAMGGQTTKLKYGHRGANQPVRDLRSGRTFITSQNHGYAVVADSLTGIGEEILRNANDGSCEGMLYRDAMTVQFHPEACSGPHDTGFLFDEFMSMMGGDDHA